MLELSQINFAVNTKPLENAVDKLAALGTAAAKLSGDFKKLDKASADAAINQNKVNLVAEKTATQAAKTAEVIERTETKKLKAIEKTTKATKDAQTAQVGLVDSMERKRDLISEGWTRGESSILKTAEAIGVVGDEYKRLQSLLKDIGGLVSSPFDSSLGSLRSIQKEFDGLVLRSKLVAQGIELNSTQLKQFARIAAEASVAVKKMGMDPTEGTGLEMYNKLLTESQDAYLKVAVANKTMLDGEKLLAKQHRDTASAKNFLIKEDERMVSVMEQLNIGTNRSVSISEKAAIATANYARALKTAGVAGDEAKKKLATYSAAQQLASQKEEQRAAANLARALQPQATDVVVSLWSGQNPLTVMLQQGGQVVDLFKLSGVEANKLGQTMKTAFAGMLPSIMAVGGAVGGLLVDGVVAAGSAFTGLFTKMTLVQKVSEMTKRALASMGDDGFSAIGKLNKIMKGFNIAIGLAAAASVVALISVAVAFKQVTEAQDELTRATISSGAYLGITTKEAYALSTGLGAVGATTVDAIKVMTKLTEGGVIAADAFKMVTTAALELENVGGRSAEKTVEIFNKLGEKPVEVLSEYAIKSGLVNQAEIERINTLVKMGDEITATTEATEILSKATETEAAIIYANLSSISRLWIDIKNGTSDAWGAVQEFAGSDTIIKPLVIVMQTIAVMATEVWFAIKGIAQSLGGLGAIAAAVMTDIKNLDTNFSASKSVLEGIKETDDAREKSYKNSIARIMQEGEYSKEALEQKAKGQAALAKANSDAEKNRLAHEEAMKPWKEYEKKHLDDTLTRQQFINRAIEDANKKKIQGTTLDKKSLDFITTQAGKQWDDGNKKKKAKADPAAKELENYIKKTEERIKDLGIQASGITNDITASGKALMDIMDDKLWLSLTQEQRVQWGLMLRKSEEQEILNKKTTAEKKILEDITKIKNENDRFIQNEIQESEKLNSSLQLRLDLIGKTPEEQKKIKDSYDRAAKLAGVEAKFADQRLKIEQKFKKLRDKPNADLMQIEADRMTEQERLDKQLAQSRKNLGEEVAVAAAEDYYNEMQKILNPLSDLIMGVLLGDTKEAVADFRKALETEFIRKPLKVDIDGFISGVTSGGNSKGGDLGSVVGNKVGSSIKDTLMSTLGLAGVGTAFSGAASAGYALAAGGNAMATIGSGASMIGSATGLTSAAAGAGQIVGAAAQGVTSALAAIPGWGWAAMAVLAIASMKGTYVQSLGESVSKVNPDGSMSLQGSGGNNDVSIGGGLNIRQTELSDNFVKGLSTSYFSQAKRFGIEPPSASFGAGFNDSDGGKFAVETKIGSKSYDPGQFKISDANLELEASRAVFFALKNSELPKKLAGVFDGLSAEKATVQDINNIYKVAEAYSTLGSQLDVLNIQGLTDLNFKTLEIFSTLSGGIDNFGNLVAGYYTNFYTDQEKIATTTGFLSKQFEQLGITMPAVNESTRAWYRSEVERQLALDQSIPANAKATAALLGLQEQVNQVAPAFDTLKETVRSAKDILAEHNSLQDEYNQLTMTATQLSDLKKASLDESNQSLYEDIQLVKKKQTIDSEAKGLQDELNQLTMTEIQLNDLKRSSLSEQNKTLYDSVQAAKAAKAAVDAFNGAMSGLNNTGFGLENDLMSLQGNDDGVQKRTRTRDLAELTKGLSQQDALIVTQTYDYNEGLKQRIKEQQKANDLATQQAEDAAKAQELAMNAVKQSTDDALQSLIKVTEVEKKRLEVVRNAASQTVDRLKGIFGLLKDEISSIYGSVSSTASGQAANGNALINQVLSSGVLPDQKDLADAISAIRAEQSSNIYSSQFEAEKAQLVLANKLTVMKDLAGYQLSEAENALLVAEKQLEVLEDSINMYQKQINELRGIKTGILSIVDAVNALNAALAVEKAGVPIQPSSPSGSSGAGGSGGSLTVSDYQKRVDAISPLGESDRRAVLEQIDLMASQQNISVERALYNYAIANGINAGMVDKYLGFAPGSSNSWAKDNNLPQFDVGTNYVTKDMTARIHEGEAIVPKAFNPSVFGNNEQVAYLLSIVVEKLQEGNENSNATAVNTFKTQKMLDGVMPDRDSIQVKVV